MYILIYILKQNFKDRHLEHAFTKYIIEVLFDTYVQTLTTLYGFPYELKRYHIALWHFTYLSLFSFYVWTITPRNFFYMDYNPS